MISFQTYRKGQGSALEMILEHGGKASLKDVNKRGLTALGEAILAGHTCIASILLKARRISYEANASARKRCSLT